MTMKVLLWSPEAKKIENLLDWAITPFPNGMATNVTRNEDYSVGMLRKQAQKAEKQWGNAIINQTNNGNWTTNLGENLVFEVQTTQNQEPDMIFKLIFLIEKDKLFLVKKQNCFKRLIVSHKL